MYKITVISEFSSAHMLRHYKGKCENLHGHNWKIEVSMKSDELDELGMVADFKELKKKVNVVLDTLDHKNLNDLDCFKKLNPTSENIAKYIYDQMTDQRPKTEDQKLAVTVWESESAYATYSEDK